MGFGIFKFLRTMARHSWVSCYLICLIINEILQISPLGDGLIISLIFSMIINLIFSLFINCGKHALVNMAKKKIDEHFGTNKDLIRFKNDEIEAKTNDGVTAYIPYSFVSKYANKKECQDNNLSFSEMFKVHKPEADLLEEKLHDNSL